MHRSIQGRQASASSAEDGARDAASKPKPGSRMPSPPSFTVTFGQVARSRIAACHRGSTLLPPVAADAEDAAAMIEYDRRSRESTGERGQSRDLVEVEPGVEGQAERREMREAGAEGRAVQHVSSAGV
jgi:hypothetical protein